MTHSSKSSTPGSRIHGLDSLRAVAMLLGIVLHACIAYKVKPEPAWPHDEQQQSIILDYLFDIIHAFRMPLFYFIAGYFCLLLIRKVGISEFIKRRWQRIGIPFLVSLITILPFSMAPFMYLRTNPSLPVATRVLDAFKSSVAWNGLAHLWFLYYLLWFYGIVVVARYLLSKLNKSESKTEGSYLPFAAPLFMILLFLSLYILPDWYIHVYTGFVVPPAQLFYYGLFFYGGMAMYAGYMSLKKTAKFSPLWLLVAIISTVFIYKLGLPEKADLSFSDKMLRVSLLTVQVGSLTFGILGAFIRFFNLESHFWRYISDASYWVYLLHVGILTWLQIVFIQEGVNIWLGLFGNLLITSVLTFVSYHYLVRYTVLGRYLHGSRKRR